MLSMTSRFGSRSLSAAVALGALVVFCAVLRIPLCSARSAFASASQARGEALDFLLVGGQVVDGTGSEPWRADIGIRGERIAFVGDAAAARLQAKQTFSVAGLIVAPGFIDPHTHADSYLGSPTRRNNLNY